MKCADPLIPFNVDGSNQVACGDCDPSSSYPFIGCSISQICNDSGRCQEIQQYALYNLKCPHPGTQLCGQLNCINRKCVSCAEGEQNNTLTCKNGIFQNYLDPMILLFVAYCLFVVIMIGLQLIIAFCLRCRRLNKLRLIKSIAE